MAEDHVDTLRARIQVGLDELDRGEGEEWTPALMERISREADELYRRGEQPDPDAGPAEQVSRDPCRFSWRGDWPLPYDAAPRMLHDSPDSTRSNVECPLGATRIRVPEDA